MLHLYFLKCAVIINILFKHCTGLFSAHCYYRIKKNKINQFVKDLLTDLWAIQKKKTWKIWTFVIYMNNSYHKNHFMYVWTQIRRNHFSLKKVFCFCTFMTGDWSTSDCLAIICVGEDPLLHVCKFVRCVFGRNPQDFLNKNITLLTQRILLVTEL